MLRILTTFIADDAIESIVNSERNLTLWSLSITFKLVRSKNAKKFEDRSNSPYEMESVNWRAPRV